MIKLDHLNSNRIHKKSTNLLNEALINQFLDLCIFVSFTRNWKKIMLLQKCQIQVFWNVDFWAIEICETKRDICCLAPTTWALVKYYLEKLKGFFATLLFVPWHMWLWNIILKNFGLVFQKALKHTIESRHMTTRCHCDLSYHNSLYREERP